VPEEIIGELRGLNVPFFRSPERGLRALARVTEFANRRAAPPSIQSVPSGKRLAPGTIPEYRAKQLLAEIGVAVPNGAFVTDVAEAKAAAQRVGYPVAIKAQSPALSHKSDVGGVILGLADEAVLAAGWDKLHRDIGSARADLRLEGVLVEAMARPGVELILGARNDADWGPVLVIGLGGVFAEALHDVRVLPANLTPAVIADELLRLKGAALLRAFRGAPARDVAAVAQMAARLGAFMQARPEVAEVDINPVIAYGEGEGAVALDALMVVR